MNASRVCNGLHAAALLLLLLAGCAGLTVEPVAEDKDKDARGVRFYEEAPFLFVYPDGQGGVAAEVKWLPDTRQLMAARPYAVLAKNETTLEFTGSALTSATLITDETVVVKASLEALGKVLAAAANTKTKEATIPPPRLYRIVVNGDKSEIGLEDSETLDKNGDPIVIHLTLPGA